MNARSIRNKQLALHFEIVLGNDPDVIAITETWLSESDPSISFFLCNKEYRIFRSDRSDQSGHGGVALLVRKNIKSQIWEHSIPNIECICALLKLEGQSLIIANIYKPSVQDTHLLQPIEQLIAKLSGSPNPYILLGDFNLPGIDWYTGTSTTNFNQDKFLDTFNRYALYQHVTEPTRGLNMLDLVFSNEQHIIKNLMIGPPLANSDHSTISFYINIGRCEMDGASTSREMRAWLNVDKEGAIAELQLVEWAEVFTPATCMNEIWYLFANIMQEVINRYVPLRRPTGKKQHFPKHIRRLILQKRKIHRENFPNPDCAASVRLNMIDQRINEHVYTYTKQKETNFLQKAGKDQRKFYQYTSSKLKSRPNIAALSGPDGLVFDDEIKAQMFSDHYKSIFVNDSGQNRNTEVNDNQRPNSLEYIYFTPEKVLKALRNCSSSISSGPDGFPPAFLKSIAEGIAAPLSIIFQHSIETGTLPDDWLCGNVIPIYKGKGKDSETISYRPISLTSAPCKVMEKIVKDEIVEYLDTKGIITKNQHGFLSKRSTQTQLLECLNDWTRLLDAKEYVDVLYIDIAKAFDTVSHSILMYKLAKYGIGGKLLDWIACFLTRRCQVVKVGKHTSSTERVLSGVPQGSVLGPILFLIYINDLVDVVQSCNIKIFADDTKLYFKVKHDADYNKFAYDARKVFGWAHKNRLSIAMHKCEVLHVGFSNPSRPLFIEGALLDEALTVKDLGIIMSKSLRFTNHINSITKSAYQCSNLIFRCFTTRESEFLVKMFTSFCRPKLEFNTCVWSPHHVSEIVMVENVQRRFTKRINGLRDLTYAERLARLGLKSLEYRRIAFDLYMTYSICNNQVDLNFHDFFIRNQGRTRGHSWKLLVPVVNSDTRKYFFAHRVVAIWNSLPEDVVSARTIASFKVKLKSVSLDRFLRFPEFHSIEND
jgi:hypothetical protein